MSLLERCYSDTLMSSFRLIVMEPYRAPAHCKCHIDTRSGPIMFKIRGCLGGGRMWIAIYALGFCPKP